MATKQEQQFKGILKLAADTRRSLRASDVDRVMSEAQSQRVTEAFRQWLLAGPLSDRTRDEVAEWVPEGTVVGDGSDSCS